MKSVALKRLRASAVLCSGNTESATPPGGLFLPYLVTNHKTFLTEEKSTPLLSSMHHFQNNHPT